ncbi:MAG: helix-turn-helix domain-containing protein [Actinomycetota bacterium]
MTGGQVIREARRRAGLTQTDLARRLGTRQPVVARWESGDRSPSFDSVTRAVRACGFELHPRIAAPDPQAEAVLSRWRRMTPKERLERNQDMLATEEWAHSARVVQRSPGHRARARR